MLAGCSSNKKGSCLQEHMQIKEKTNNSEGWKKVELMNRQLTSIQYMLIDNPLLAYFAMFNS